jgi:hypothetical protein
MDPIHTIQVKVWAFEDEEMAKERARQRRQERWDTAVESVKAFFSLDRFRPKPALDLDASLSHARDDAKVAPPASASPRETRRQSDQTP